MKINLQPSIILFCFCLLCFNNLAQNNPRPKVGLVLSGGGAKGLAHIGVIKVLEEAGIQPDYITGTSMGSILGALYASGYTGKELDSIVRYADWPTLLSDHLSLTNVAPEEKQDFNSFLLEFEINKKGLKIPSGMVKGQSISQLFSELTWPVAEIKNFDDLPIPFRCVAADLITGDPYVFKSGDLMTAMRSSMAIPSVFTPVELDSLFLVDGGIIDNYPVQECLKMGADIIIGVNVDVNDNRQKEDINTLPQILIASTFIGNKPRAKEAEELADYSIKPDLAKFTTASFMEAPAIIEKGEQAAKLYYNDLKTLADSLNNIAPTPVIKRPKRDSIIINDIEILNSKHISYNYFISKLGFKKGDKITPKDINNGINLLLGTRFYNKITYELIPHDDRFNVVFHTTENTRAMAKFSLQYDNELNIGIISNLTLRNLLAKNSRLSLTTDISENPRATLDILTYIGDKQRLGIFMDGKYEYSIFPLYYENNIKDGTMRYRLTEGGGGFLFSNKKNSALKLSAYAKKILLSQKEGLDEVFYSEEDKFGNVFYYSQLGWMRNTFNDAFFPTQGSNLSLCVGANLKKDIYFSGSDSTHAIVSPVISNQRQQYIKANLMYQKAFGLSKNYTLITSLYGGAITNDDSYLDMHFVGGTNFNAGEDDIPFVGLSFRERVVQNYSAGRLNFMFNFAQIMHANVIVNGLYSTNFGNSNKESLPFVLNRDEFVLGYGVSLSLDSLIGPITLGAGSNHIDNKIRLYVNIGYPFHR